CVKDDYGSGLSYW
nr:immunoglobulin heavy chain junction region [Macaca mulatta]MOV38328.1 immunoglobulin heavy chain junction region [Macaca mulatta]MOV40530.1 immunoglobulin heavy chain junction region [Macaca mulatta]MOV41403.1 immunoglobulin heavy chain junction region [Macaca mulatta]MOV41488.1 immunoglobulin heavy chain junction region [Macaca mulatta]